MRLSIELEATAKLEIDVNEDIIVDVMQNYNGDFKEWSRNNYNDYMCFNDFEIEFDGVSYDEDKALEIIKKSKDILGCDDDFNIDRVILHRTALRSRACDTPTIDEDIEEFKIDIDLVAKAINYTDFKNPKFELNYIHLNKNTVSATDTKKLIHITNHKYSFDNILFPPSFIEPLQNGAKCFINQDGQIYLKYKNHWFMGNNIISSWTKNINFPSVDNILLSEKGYKDKQKVSFKKFTSNSFTQKYQGDTYPKEMIKFKAEDRWVYIKEIYYNETVAVHDDLDSVYYDKRNPICFVGANMQIVIMPVYLD